MNKMTPEEYNAWLREMLEGMGFRTVLNSDSNHKKEPTTWAHPKPDLEPVDIVVYNRSGNIIFENKMPEVEFMKSFADLFDHVERINKGHTFRVW